MHLKLLQFPQKSFNLNIFFISFFFSIVLNYTSISFVGFYLFGYIQLLRSIPTNRIKNNNNNKMFGKTLSNSIKCDEFSYRILFLSFPIKIVLILLRLKAVNPSKTSNGTTIKVYLCSLKKIGLETILLINLLSIYSIK